MSAVVEPIEGTDLVRETHEHDFSEQRGNGQPYWACSHTNGDGVKCPEYVTALGAGAPPGEYVYRSPAT